MARNSHKDLIFIDESGVNLAMVKMYARALKGKRARGEKPLKRGKNISLISAISKEKVVASFKKSEVGSRKSEVVLRWRLYSNSKYASKSKIYMGY